MEQSLMLSAEWVILTIIYVVLACVNAYAVIIYRKAFYLMKKTIMIKSVYCLMVALLIENIYFALTAIFVGFNTPLGSLFMHPLMWAIPKFILLTAIIYFVTASLSPTKEVPCDKVKEVKK